MSITKIIETCGACPEQYDVFNSEGEQVGYLRLRHGYYSVSAGNPSGPVIFARTFPVNEEEKTEPEEKDIPRHYSDGAFESYEARTAYLTIALRKIAEFYGYDEVSYYDIEQDSVY